VAEHDEPVEPDESLDFLLADTDITFLVFFAPHLGQASPFSSFGEKINLSKIFLHLLHLNSYIGIADIPFHLFCFSADCCLGLPDLSSLIALLTVSKRSDFGGK
jgi:hypothetical protein